MSGGHFNYDQHRVRGIAYCIDTIISDNNRPEYKYPPEVIAKFREASHELKRASEMAQRVDYLVCGDDGNDTFLERWDKEVRGVYEGGKDVTSA